MPTVIREFGYGYGALYIVADSVFWLIALSLVVGSFVFNLNGKAKPAIICAAASAIVVGSPALLQGAGFFAILDILPQITLIVFLLKQKKNVRMWAYLALVAVFLPTTVSWLQIIMIVDFARYSFVTSYLPSIIISLLCDALPLGLVYYLGFTACNDSTQQSEIVKKATAYPYLEAYKQNRKNGEK